MFKHIYCVMSSHTLGICFQTATVPSPLLQPVSCFTFGNHKNGGCGKSCRSEPRNVSELRYNLGERDTNVFAMEEVNAELVPTIDHAGSLQVSLLSKLV